MSGSALVFATVNDFGGVNSTPVEMLHSFRTASPRGMKLPPGHSTFPSKKDRMKKTFRWTRGPRPTDTHRIQLISAGMREIYQLVLFPATGPSHCAALAYTLHPAGRRQESRYLCGNLVFGPPYLIRRSSLFHARRTCLLTAAHPTHSASWAGLCEGAKRKLSTCGA